MELYFNSITPESMGYDAEGFTDFCEANDLDWKDNDGAFYRWQDEGCVYEWDNLMDDVKAFDKANDGYYYVEGTLGLWDGKRSVFALFPTLREAINECVSGVGSCVLTSKADGSVEIRAVHHDGYNVFVIKRITYDSYLRWDGNHYVGEFEPTIDEVLPIR